ncbi:MAG: hypothetical protein Fur0044_30750 [Anaerolineae bacterium]
MEIEVARPLSGLWPKSKIQNPSWVVVVGSLTLAIYLALLPFVERTWRATGDEPHYLLAAHSLVVDGDFDLANNYSQLDYLNFYLSRDITPQVRLSPGGQQILDHQLGLSVLIAPVYALGGRGAVLVFQAILGGLLAGLTFKLALLVSQDTAASFLATLFVALSPPLLLYHYLVYPELLGALLTTMVVYYALSQNQATLTVFILTLLALIILPWLNRRFVPLAMLLAVLLVWKVGGLEGWRVGRLEGWSFFGRFASPPRLFASSPLRRLARFASPLLFTLLSIGLLFWFDSRLVKVGEPDITAPTITSIFWDRLARGLVGWLVDQQRGLFIFAPIYAVALWGAPFLIGDGLRGRNCFWWVMLPFGLALGVTAIAGGFWTAWELGPRFLVVALPSLAPLLALAWRNYRSTLWRGAVLLLFGVSLGHSWIILQNPELPYKSSLPLYYSETRGWPLTEWLPDLAGYAEITPAPGGANSAQVVADQGRTGWLAEAGRTVKVVQADLLTKLPFGHYYLNWPLRVEPGLPSEAEVLRLSLKLSGGGQVFNRVVTAADLPADNSYSELQIAFRNPNVDRWRTPPVFSAVATGAGQLWAGPISFTPDPFYALFLPYLVLALLVLAAWASWRRFGSNQSSSKVTMLQTPPLLLGSLALILPLATFGYLAYQSRQESRTYQAAEFSHFVGREGVDPETRSGLAWLVDPQLDPPQKAIYGPFDIFEAGQYRVTFRLKLPEAVQTEQDIARLQVAATANYDLLLAQPLRREHFSKPNVYHDFVLTVTNPRRQALSFEVYYLGVAPLLIDKVTIARVGG